MKSHNRFCSLTNLTLLILGLILTPAVQANLSEQKTITTLDGEDILMPQRDTVDSLSAVVYRSLILRADAKIEQLAEDVSYLEEKYLKLDGLEEKTENLRKRSNLIQQTQILLNLREKLEISAIEASGEEDGWKIDPKLLSNIQASDLLIEAHQLKKEVEKTVTDVGGAH